jgi:rhamnulose-1-phosphate aldolase
MKKAYEKFSKSAYVKEMLEAARLMSVRGWAERNAGNMSRVIPYDEAEKYFDLDKPGRSFALELGIKELSGKIFLITATGTYFRKLHNNISNGLGVVRVSADGKRLELLWGFEGGNSPTSEMGMHFMGHLVRLKVNPDNRVIIHTHAGNTIAMSSIEELDEKALTLALWRMHSECIVVFPDGVGLLPWMVPGTRYISKATAKKIKDYRLVIWPLHGIIAAGESMDEAMGLIETVEKAAEIYVKSIGLSKSQRVITDKQLLEIAKRFKVSPREGILAESNHLPDM